MPNVRLRRRRIQNNFNLHPIPIKSFLRLCLSLIKYLILIFLTFISLAQITFDGLVYGSILLSLVYVLSVVSLVQIFCFQWSWLRLVGDYIDGGRRAVNAQIVGRRRTVDNVTGQVQYEVKIKYRYPSDGGIGSDGEENTNENCVGTEGRGNANDIGCINDNEMFDGILSDDSVHAMDLELVALTGNGIGKDRATDNDNVTGVDFVKIHKESDNAKEVEGEETKLCTSNSGKEYTKTICSLSDGVLELFHTQDNNTRILLLPSHPSTSALPYATIKNKHRTSYLLTLVMAPCCFLIFLISLSYFLPSSYFLEEALEKSSYTENFHFLYRFAFFPPIYVLLGYIHNKHVQSFIYGRPRVVTYFDDAVSLLDRCGTKYEQRLKFFFFLVALFIPPLPVYPAVLQWLTLANIIGLARWKSHLLSYVVDRNVQINGEVFKIEDVQSFSGLRAYRNIVIRYTVEPRTDPQGDWTVLTTVGLGECDVANMDTTFELTRTNILEADGLYGVASKVGDTVPIRLLHGHLASGRPHVELSSEILYCSIKRWMLLFLVGALYLYTFNFLYYIQNMYPYIILQQLMTLPYLYESWDLRARRWIKESLENATPVCLNDSS